MNSSKEKTKPRPGDLVEAKLVKKTYNGIFVESSGDEKEAVLLKLKSGYNIGIRKKDILDFKIIKKFEEEKGEKFELEKKKDKPSIGMIITGGTIASRLDPKTGAANPLTEPKDFFKFYPEIFENVNVAKVEIPFMKASEDMDYKDWQKIAKTAEKLLNDSNIQGIIVTHGTDFLHYTASALSFFLKNLNKPVVLTYSQRSIDRASSDATLNLECSALAAISDMAEVFLVGHATTNDDYCLAIRGTKARKLHSSRRDAFKSVNAKPLAKIFSDKIVKISDYNLKQKGKNKVKADTKFEEKVALVKIYPGQNPEILDYYLTKKYKGLILEIPGLGHVPSKQSRNNWLKKIKEIQEKGITVCAAAQTIYGRLDPLVYSNGRELLDAGIIFLEDMLSETALVKLGWILGHEEWAKDKNIVKEKMLENIAGEFSDRLEE